MGVGQEFEAVAAAKQADAVVGQSVETLEPRPLFCVQRPGLARASLGRQLVDQSLVGGDHRAGPGVLEDQLELGRRGVGATRHRHQAGARHRLVGGQPLAAVVGEKGHPIARIEPGSEQADRDCVDLAVELPVGAGGDLGGAAPPQCCHVRPTPRGSGQEITHEFLPSFRTPRRQSQHRPRPQPSRRCRGSCPGW